MNERKWVVYRENINTRKIVPMNIFDHYSFAMGCDKVYKKHKDDKDKFAEEIRHELMYYFWSKCEYEVVINSWIGFEKTKGIKIDIYDQVMLNWEIFIDYLWGYYTNKKKTI